MERKKGKWINSYPIGWDENGKYGETGEPDEYNGFPFWICSECRIEYYRLKKDGFDPVIVPMVIKFNYCPHCGREMT